MVCGYKVGIERAASRRRDGRKEDVYVGCSMEVERTGAGGGTGTWFRRGDTV